MAVEAPSDIKTPLASQNSELLEAMTYEIERLRSDAQYAGWSQWALMGAFAALLWLIGDVLQAASVKPANVLVVGVTIWFGYVVIHHLLWLLSSKTEWPAPTTAGPRVDPSVRRGRASLALSGVICLTLVVAINACNVASTGVIRLVQIWYGFWGLLTIVIMLLSMLIPLESRRRPMTGITIIVLADLAVALLALMHLVGVVKVQGVTIDEWRIAGAAFACVYVVQLWLKHMPMPAMLDALSTVRRDLSLGRITNEEARDRFDLVLEGMKAEDLLQQHVAASIASIERMEGSISDATATVAAAQSRLDQLDGIISAEDAQLLLAALDNAILERKRMRAISAQITRDLRRLRLRLIMLAGLGPGAPALVRETLGRVESQLEGAINKSQACDALLDKAIKTLEERVDQAKRNASMQVSR